tara:strand:- start:167 stop:328 length:162 start_codon:yes stop_codon:yes gene_type:complete
MAYTAQFIHFAGRRASAAVGCISLKIYTLTGTTSLLFGATILAGSTVIVVIRE